MLPIEKLPAEVMGLDPEMTQELEERIREFERDHEASIIEKGEGYVPKIRKGDYLFAGIVNIVIAVYLIVAVIIM